MLLRDFSFQFKCSGTIARTTLLLTLIVTALVTKISQAESFQAGLNAMGCNKLTKCSMLNLDSACCWCCWQAKFSLLHTA